jgi:hypothetical protein
LYRKREETPRRIIRLTLIDKIENTSSSKIEKTTPEGFKGVVSYNN